MFAGGTTKQHQTSCIVTYPALPKLMAQESTSGENYSLLQGWVVLQMPADGFAHHGVFPHEHNSLVAQGQTDGLHLLGAHIVCTHNEAFWIIIQKLLKEYKIKYVSKKIIHF